MRGTVHGRPTVPQSLCFSRRYQCQLKWACFNDKIWGQERAGKVVECKVTIIKGMNCILLAPLSSELKTHHINMSLLRYIIFFAHLRAPPLLCLVPSTEPCTQWVLNKELLSWLAQMFCLDGRVLWNASNRKPRSREHFILSMTQRPTGQLMEKLTCRENYSFPSPLVIVNWHGKWFLEFQFLSWIAKLW